MTNAVAHRGPDDQGMVVRGLEERTIALGSRRLAIIDLSSAGHMPMVDADTGTCIVFNGEIYNHQLLRDELRSLGESFTSHTDTEVVLKAYKLWGLDCLSRFVGMFALAVFDGRTKDVVLARDWIGEKPLYYAQNDREDFLFASEVRSLLDSGLVDRRLDPESLHNFLFNGFVVSPRTIIRDVRALLPGYVMVVGPDGRIRRSEPYTTWPSPAVDARPAERQKEDLRERITLAVKRQLVSDVPLGAFFSGGLDSSIVAALMSEFGREPRTFCVGFPDRKGFDESANARAAAAALGLHHTTIDMGASEYPEYVVGALEAMDQPTFDGVNSYIASRCARQAGLTVCLSGFGADEIFGGYPYFKDISRLFRVAKLYNNLPSGLNGLISRTLRGRPLWLAGPIKSLHPLLMPETANSNMLLACYQARQMLYPPWTLPSLLAPELLASARWIGLPQEFEQYLALESVPPMPAMAGISHLASRIFLGERCLRDLDAMSMSVSLEVRSPFVDRTVVEAAWQVPADERCAGIPNKRFEYDVFSDLLRGRVPFQRKHGFNLPFDSILRDPIIAESARDMLTYRDQVASIGLQPKFVCRIHDLFYSHGKVPWSRVWALIVLISWTTKHRVTA